MKLKIKKIDAKAKTPTYATDQSAGMDLYAMVPSNRVWVTIPAHKCKLIHTGITAAIPQGYFGAIFARSGLALRDGLRPANCVGVIDSDYRGEIMVAMRNDSELTKNISDGERIAQLVLIPYEHCEFEIVEELDATNRGVGGFGSTGKD